MSDTDELRSMFEAAAANHRQIESMKWALYAELYPSPHHRFDEDTMRKLDGRWTAETDMPPLNDSRQWRFAMAKAGVPTMARRSTPWRSAVQAVAEWVVGLRQPKRKRTGNNAGAPTTLTEDQKNAYITEADGYASDRKAGHNMEIGRTRISELRKELDRPRRH